jgi:hypothetical protein
LIAKADIEPSATDNLLASCNASVVDFQLCHPKLCCDDLSLRYNAISPTVPETVPSFHVAENNILKTPAEGLVTVPPVVFGGVPGGVPIGDVKAVVLYDVGVTRSVPRYIW